MAQDLLKDTVSTVSVLVVTIFLLISFPFFPVVCSFFLNATFLGVTLLAICFAVKQIFFFPFTRIACHLFCLEAARDCFAVSTDLLIYFGGFEVLYVHNF